MAQVKIHRDGTVETFCGTQDIGGGARTVCLLRTSQELGYLPLEKISVHIGHSAYGASGASAGSSTTAGVSKEIRDAVHRTLGQLFELVAAQLKVDASTLEIREGGTIAPKGADGMKWSDATLLIRDSLIGHAPTPKDPDAQWCVMHEDGTAEQATEGDYRA